MHVTKPIDLDRLARELAAAGVAVPGLSLEGSDTDAELTTFAPPDENGVAAPIDLPPEAQPVVDAHDASKGGIAAQFEDAEDAERLALVNERALTDPAFAALVELTLKKE